jgi:Tol biopolymer transport system component
MILNTNKIEKRTRTMLTPETKTYTCEHSTTTPIVLLMALLAVSTTVMLAADAEITFGDAVNLGPSVNSPENEFDPCISVDGLELYFNSYRSGGLGNADIWVATRRTRTDAWGAPVNLGATVNSPDHENSPNISTDGLSLYFCSDRSGGCGGRDVYVTTRKTKRDPWGAPVNLGPSVNSRADEHGPSISSDGLSLYFSGLWDDLKRAGGLGEADIWLTTRQTVADPWGKPVNLGATVNSPRMDESPSISADGLSLYFNSNRPQGHGMMDIWVTTRKTKSDPWGEPVNLGPSVNSMGWEGNPDISGDGSILYFASSWSGGSGSIDLWMVSLKKTRAIE